MTTKVNAVPLQRGDHQLHKRSPEESDDEDLEALRAAALASMSKPRERTIHRGGSGSDYYYESYEEDEVVETEVEVEVTDSEPEPAKKHSMSDDFDDDCIAFHCDEVNEFASIEEGKTKKKKFVKQKKLVKRLVRKSRKVFVPRVEKISTQTLSKRSQASSVSQAHARTPTSPLKYRSRSRSPRPRYRHSPLHDRSISPYRHHRRPYSPYESDRLSPHRDFRPSDERQRSLHRYRRYDQRSSRSPNVRERSPPRWSYPKHRPHSQSPLRERDAISDRAYRPHAGAPSGNSTDEYKPRASNEVLGSINRSKHSSESRLPNSRAKIASSPITVSTTNGSPSISDRQPSPLRSVNHAVSSTTSPGVAESTQPLGDEKRIEKISLQDTEGEESLGTKTSQGSESPPKQENTQEKEEISLVVSIPKNLATKQEDKSGVTICQESPIDAREPFQSKIVSDVNNTGDLREQIEQLRRLRNQSPGLPILKTVELATEVLCDLESERPFKATNRIVKPPSKVTVEKLPIDSTIKGRNNSRNDTNVTTAVTKSKKKNERDVSAPKKRKRTFSSDSSSDSSEPPSKKSSKKKDKIILKKKSRKSKKSKKSKLKKRKYSSSSSSDSSDSSSDSEPRSRRRRRNTSSRRRRSSDTSSSSSSSSSDRSLERLKILKEKSKNEKLRLTKHKISESSRLKPGTKNDLPMKEKSSKSSAKTELSKNKSNKTSRNDVVIEKKKKKTKPESKSNKKKKEKRKSTTDVSIKVEKTKSKDKGKSDLTSTKKRIN